MISALNLLAQQFISFEIPSTVSGVMTSAATLVAGYGLKYVFDTAAGRKNRQQSELQIALNSWKDRAEKADEQIASLRDDKRKLYERIGELGDEVTDLRIKLGSKQSELDVMTGELRDVHGEHKALAERMASLFVSAKDPEKGEKE